MKYTVEVTKENTKWFKEGTSILHREDGPAITNCNGIKKWYLNGQIHRIGNLPLNTLMGLKLGIKMMFFIGKMVQLLNIILVIPRII